MPGNSAYLIKAIDIDFGMLDGAMVQLNTLNQTLAALDVGPEGSVFMMDSQGSLLSSRDLPYGLDDGFRTAVLQMKKRAATIKWKDNNYLVLTQDSQYADIRYVLVTTEPYILKKSALLPENALLLDPPALGCGRHRLYPVSPAFLVPAACQTRRRDAQARLRHAGRPAARTI
ncbi:hypothetical protein D3C76_197590 [compost metagenome]